MLLRAQAERCRHILAELAGGGEQHDLIVSRLPLSHLIEEVVAPHRLVAVPIEVKTGPAEGESARGPLAGAGDRAQSRHALRPRQSGGERHRLRREQGRGRGALVEGRGEDRHRRRRRGFPPHVLEQLGEPFVTTRPAQRERREAGRRACRHGTRLLHRQDAARAVRAPGSSSPTGRYRRAAPWSRCAGRGRNSSTRSRKPPQRREPVA